MVLLESLESDVGEGRSFSDVDELEAVTSSRSRWQQPRHHNSFETADLAENGFVEEPERVGSEILPATSGAGWGFRAAGRMQRFLSCREQGRLAELLCTPEEAEEPPVRASAWRAAVALGHAELGLMRRARSCFERLADRDFASIPRDEHWGTAIAFLAEACALLADEPRAAILHGLLRPYAERFIVGRRSHCLGSTSRYLALLSQTLGRNDHAIELFDDAVAANRHIGAWTWVAWSQYGCAEALLDRDEPGDRERAFGLLDAALGAAAELGMRRLFEHSLVLRTSAVRGDRLSARDSGSATILDRSTAKPIPKPRVPDVSSNVWCKGGDFWTIAFASREVRLRHTKGLVYIGELLRHPMRELHVADLCALTMGRCTRRDAPADLPAERDFGPLLDRVATAAYRKRLRDLQEELESATSQSDLGRAERARHEMEIIEHELTVAYGLGGRARRAGDSSERMRKAVTNQIRRALGKIRDAHPRLGRHLRTSIRTGILCSYAPDLPTEWIVGEPPAAIASLRVS